MSGDNGPAGTVVVVVVEVVVVVDVVVVVVELVVLELVVVVVESSEDREQALTARTSAMSKTDDRWPGVTGAQCRGQPAKRRVAASPSATATANSLPST